MLSVLKDKETGGFLKSSNKAEKCLTGITGIDEILSGGLPRNHLYLLQGKPGTGKTTMALQFLLEGIRSGEKCLYITFSETASELTAVASSHHFDLSQLTVLELSALSAAKSSEGQSLFHPSEVELSQIIKLILEKIQEVRPSRVVFDSVSELRLLAETSLRYRRQMLSFKEFFIGRGATVLFLDDMTTEAGDTHVQSIVHGVMLLEKFRAAYGVERRQFHIVKLRGVAFKGGTHDYLINTGGLHLFPRLVAGEHNSSFSSEVISSGVPALDSLLGGGLDRGTSNLILGPAGTGKSTIALRFAVSAADQGKKVSIYSFEESSTNLFKRATALGMDIEKHIKSGHLRLRKIDPAEMTPGQFSFMLHESAQTFAADMVVIDSLNGYVHAMPEQQFLMLQLHELLSFLGSRGVVTILVLAQAGMMGPGMQTPLDLTYLADTVVLTRFFEAFGKVKKAISITKRRTGKHEESLRELQIGHGGVIVGPVLDQFEGIFSGIPKFVGPRTDILEAE